MKQSLFIVLLISCSIAGLIGYCAALIDWVQDYRTGVYERNHGEAFFETVALCLYTFFGLRFLKLKIPFF